MAQTCNLAFAKLCDEIDALSPYFMQRERSRELSADADAWKQVVVCLSALVGINSPLGHLLVVHNSGYPRRSVR